MCNTAHEVPWQLQRSKSHSPEPQACSHSSISKTRHRKLYDNNVVCGGQNK